MPEATPTVTPTSGPSIPQRAAGTVQTSTTGLLVVPNILSAILGHVGGLSLRSVSPLSIGPISFTCPTGGGQVSCSQQLGGGLPPTLGPPTYDVELSDCAVTGAGGTTVNFKGSLSATGKQGDFCGSIPNDVTVSISTLTVTSTSVNGMTTAIFTNVSGSVSLSGQDNACTYSTAALKLVGTMDVAFEDSMGAPLGSTAVTFAQGSSIEINVTQYGDNCVPTIYDATVQGMITFESNGASFAATFTDYLLHNDASSGNNMVEVSGMIASECLGAPVTLSTTTDLLVPGAVPCPQAGEVLVMTAGNPTDLVRYTNAGGVEIDLGNNGDVDRTFGSCLDPALFQCPAS